MYTEAKWFLAIHKMQQSKIQRHSYFRDIIKNKEIANPHVLDLKQEMLLSQFGCDAK
jgi:hypothetical protein